MELLKFINKSDLTEVVIEQKDLKLKVKRGGAAPAFIAAPVAAESTPAVPVAAPPAPAAAPPKPAVQAQAAAEAAETGQVITSPMVGTFYRKPAPDKPNFVEVGSVVNKGDVLCIIEAMKLFNEIEAEVSGKILKVLVEDETSVQYDQPLFEIEPA